MKEFRYSALTGGGQTISGIREAPSPEHLAADLLEQGLVLLKSKPTLGGIFSGSRRINRKELRDFTQHMATCLGAGVTAVSAIEDFQRQTPGVLGRSWRTSATTSTAARRSTRLSPAIRRSFPRSTSR